MLVMYQDKQYILNPVVFNFLYIVMCRLTFNWISFPSSVQISRGESSPESNPTSLVVAKSPLLL